MLQTKNTAGRTAQLIKGFAMLFALPLLTISFYILGNYMYLDPVFILVVILGFYLIDFTLRKVVRFDGQFDYAQVEPRMRANIALNLLILNAVLLALSLGWNTHKNTISAIMVVILTVVSLAIFIFAFSFRKNELKPKQKLFDPAKGNLCRTMSYLFNAVSICVFIFSIIINWSTWFVWIPLGILMLTLSMLYVYGFSIRDEAIEDEEHLYLNLAAVLLLGVISLVQQFFFHSFFGFQLWVILSCFIGIGLLVFFSLVSYVNLRKRKISREQQKREDQEYARTKEQRAKREEENRAKTVLLIKKSSEEGGVSTNELIFLYENMQFREFLPIFSKELKSVNLSEHVFISGNPHNKIVWHEGFKTTLKLFNGVVKHNYFDDQINLLILKKVNDFKDASKQYEKYSHYERFVDEINEIFTY